MECLEINLLVQYFFFWMNVEIEKFNFRNSRKKNLTFFLTDTKKLHNSERQKHSIEGTAAMAWTWLSIKILLGWMEGFIRWYLMLSKFTRAWDGTTMPKIRTSGRYHPFTGMVLKSCIVNSVESLEAPMAATVTGNIPQQKASWP